MEMEHWNCVVIQQTQVTIRTSYMVPYVCTYVPLEKARLAFTFAAILSGSCNLDQPNYIIQAWFLVRTSKSGALAMCRFDFHIHGVASVVQLRRCSR